ncbi:hypothetical protein [Bradyrhizobium sp. 23]|uniref:hypothetical protein n=1 Tax=Bradyrhizobium sp. 23 TaxID=2782667 RepID=UPI001FFAF514|nr:hypothetical protein [Bradyrhizobium sp. 23]
MLKLALLVLDYIFVASSIRGGVAFGNVLIVYSLLEISFLSALGRGCADVVENGLGWVVTPGRPDQLAEAVRGVAARAVGRREV